MTVKSGSSTTSTGLVLLTLVHVHSSFNMISYNHKMASRLRVAWHLRGQRRREWDTGREWERGSTRVAYPSQRTKEFRLSVFMLSNGTILYIPNCARVMSTKCILWYIALSMQFVTLCVIRRVLYFVSFYYRATLCVSAVFAVARSLSVRLSVTLVYCIHTAEDIVKYFLGPVAPSF